MMKNIENKKTVGVILAYKCANFLEDLQKKIPTDVLDEVFITNDESGDNTEEVAKKIGIKCFSHPKLGYGGNMKYGMNKALELGADYIVEIHGDGQYDISFIKPALEKIKEGYGLVLGSRFTNLRQPLKDKMPIIRYIANLSLTFVDRIVLGVSASELHTGARVYSREAIEAINLTHTSNDYLFSFETIAQIAYKKFKIGEVPVRGLYMKEHTSINIKRSIVYAFATFGVLFYYILAKLGFRTKLFHK
jgi:glycosyltransferase involved in cell wall biosynthesis